jgi:regulator of replication initiation timing
MGDGSAMNVDYNGYLKQIRELEDELKRAIERTEFVIRENHELRRKLQRQRGEPTRVNPEDYDY